MKIVFVVNEERYFVSHRLSLALKAIERGWDVLLVALPSSGGPDLASMGIRVINAKLDRGGFNPFRDLAYCTQLMRLYRRERPDLVHHVTLKPVLYGAFSAWLSRVDYVVNAIAGLGSIVTSRTLRVRFIRPFIMLALRGVLKRKNSRIILQNEDDSKELTRALDLDSNCIYMTKGSGVDVSEFHPLTTPANHEVPLVVMVTRLLVEKGVYELIEASRILKARGVAARFALIGEPDPANPHSVPQIDLDAAADQGLIEVWGLRNDVSQIYQKASVAVLPSFYREGVPKSLLEAASSGLPIITTDAPGCREVVDHGVNGFLVAVRQAQPLADSLEKLLVSPELRQTMGRASREKALREFDVSCVVKQTFKAYDDLMSKDLK